MGTRIVLKNVRLAFANVFEPGKSDLDAEPKFSVRALIPKDHPQVENIKSVIQKLIDEKWADKKTRPKGLKKPLRDADKEAEDEGREPRSGYEGCYFMNASVLPKWGAPEVVDASLNKADPDTWNAGDYANISIDLHTYNKNGSAGVRAGLGNVQFIRKGAGKVAASSEFEAEETPYETDDGDD